MASSPNCLKSMLPVFAAGSSDWPATYASKKKAGRCDENEDAPFKRANVFSARIMSSRAVNFAFHTDFVERLINTSLFPKKLVTEGDADSFVCQDGGYVSRHRGTYSRSSSSLSLSRHPHPNQHP